MNYITACPACETQFLITKEHLKAYRGKVQCGNCNHVFNAKNRLTEVSEDIQNIEEYAADSDSNIFNEALDSRDEVDPESSELDEITAQSSSEDFAVDSETESILPSATHTYIEPVHHSDGKPLHEKLNVVLDGVPDLSDLNTSVNLSETMPDLNTANLASDETDSPYISDRTPVIISENDIDIVAIRAPILIEDLTADPKFQLVKPKRNAWLVVFNLILFILALLQSIYFLRSKIAADYPQFKPYLVQACAYLACTVDLPQQLDLLSIDDSDMQESEDHQDVIHFSSLLINKADHVQAYPNIELTLTDTEDKPVLRKLVKPQDYLQAPNNPASGLAAHQEERIKLAINVHDLPVAGYRVLLTY